MVDKGRQAVVRATLWGAAVAALVVAGIVLGSRGLKDFDTALVPYAGATVFSAFGLGYRYAMWLQPPADAPLLVPRLADLPAPARLPANLAAARASLFWDNFVAQSFIERRVAAALGGALAHLLGLRARGRGHVPALVRLDPLRDARATRRRSTRPSSSACRVFRFRLGEPAGAAGVQRPRHRRGAGAVGHLPRAVAARRATAARSRCSSSPTTCCRSSCCSPSPSPACCSPSRRTAMRGFHYGFLSQFHAVTVIFTLALPAVREVLPHLPAAGAARHRLLPARRRGRAGRPPARAAASRSRRSCTSTISSRSRPSSASSYRDRGGTHYQDVCPPCRRKNLALTQDGALARPGRREPRAPRSWPSCPTASTQLVDRFGPHCQTRARRRLGSPSARPTGW